MKKVLFNFLVVFVLTLVGSSFVFNEVKAATPFVDYEDNPVFEYSGVSGTFDKNRVYYQDVIKNGDEYWMYYSGVGESNSVQIGLAVSTDGIHWNRYSSLPVFKCADNTSIICNQSTSWSSYRVAVASVMYDDGVYKMWYGGNSSGPYWQLGYATSSDGINWTAHKDNYVYNAEGLPSVTYTNVIKVDDVYRLYFTDRANRKTYYTESLDGINWNDSINLIATGSVNSVDVVGDSFVAVLDTEIAFSSDGKYFDFASSTVSIDNNSTPDQARISFLLEDGDVKTWRTHNLGAVIWSYINFGINYATLDEQLFFEVETEEEPNKYPLYTQVESPYPSEEETASWADDVMPCGTIGTCGCAITSLIMGGEYQGLDIDVLGNTPDPANINSYLNSVGGYQASGAMKWLATSAYYGEMTSGGKLASRLLFPPEFVSTESVVMSEIDDALENEDKIVLAFEELNSVKETGHYVWIPEKTDDSYIVRDPLWYETEMANQEVLDSSTQKNYGNSFDEARILTVLDEPEILSGTDIEVHLQGTAELLFENALGDKVGYENGSVVIDLERAAYGNTRLIEIDGLSPYSEGGKTLLVHNAGEEFTINVVGTAEGEFELEFFTIDEFGDITTFNFSGWTLPGLVTTFTFDLSTKEVVESEIDFNQFLQILSFVLKDKTLQNQAFFAKKAEKLFEDMETKTISQVLQSIETFEKLLIAKKIEDPFIFSVLDLLETQVDEQ